jgi:hypothetical protein
VDELRDQVVFGRDAALGGEGGTILRELDGGRASEGEEPVLGGVLSVDDDVRVVGIGVGDHPVAERD